MCHKKTDKSNFIFKIINNGNENWFSFLSGIFANIPITLLLTIDKSATLWYYWLIYIASIFISIALVILSIIVTIKMMNIKERAKDAYDQYIDNAKILIPGKYDDCLKDIARSESRSISLYILLGVICIGLLLASIIGLWIIK